MIVARSHSLDKIAEEIRSWGTVGLDTETTGLRESDRLFALILSNGVSAYYFNFNGNAPADFCLDRDYTFSILWQILFKDPTITWRIHNAKFDLRMLRHEIPFSIPGKIHCTQAIERILFNNLIGKEPYSLKECAKRRGLEKDSSVDTYIEKNKLYTLIQVPGKEKPKKNKHFDRVPFEIMHKYAEQDAKLHWLIGEDQVKRMDNIQDGFPKLDRVYDIETKLTKVCYQMERNGIRIDKERTVKARDYEFGKIAEFKDRFLSLTGHPYQDSRKLFQSVFDAVGEKYPTTAKGNASFAAEVLEGMSSPIASVINSIRYHQKRVGTYYSSFLYFAGDGDRIHPNMKQGGTATGRFSYSDPNLQNIPKEDDEEDQALPYHVRECFVPSPGNVFLAIDYDQVEYRMMLDYANEKDLIKAVLAGEDVHSATARLCGITRKQAKTLNFAILYGAGPEKIAGMLKISKYEATKLKEIYLGNLPNVGKFINRVISTGRKRGFVFDWTGARLHADKDFAYTLSNHIIQGGCARVMKIAMNKTHDILEGMRTKLVLQVHDELLLDAPPEEAEVLEKIIPAMESVYEASNGMKLTASPSYSFKSYGYRDMIEGKPYDSHSANYA